MARAPRAESEEPRLEPGAKVGRYQVIRGLAVGGMAELYLARATGIEGFAKLVALKKIRKEHANDGELIRMFRDEARLAATLQHPNIAQVFDVGTAAGQLFFAMEYIEGRDLRGLLSGARAEGRLMPLEHAIHICAQAAAGLHYAHERVDEGGRPLGIVHRDVSPSNILVSRDGCAKLVDFGIAKMAGRAAVTRGGQVKGKMPYMSPEQVAGKPLDRRSDVFALGLVLYEAATGVRPFDLEHEVAIAHAIATRDVPSPSERGASVPPRLERILARALARDLEHRFPDARRLQLALESFAREEGLVLSTVTLAEYVAERCEPRSTTSALGGSGLGPELLGTASIEAATQSTASLGARAPRRGARVTIAAVAGAAAGAALLFAWQRAPIPGATEPTGIEQARPEPLPADPAPSPSQSPEATPAGSAPPAAEPPTAVPVRSTAPMPPATKPRKPATPATSKAAPSAAPARDPDAPFPGGTWKPKAGSR